MVKHVEMSYTRKEFESLADVVASNLDKEDSLSKKVSDKVEAIRRVENNIASIYPTFHGKALLPKQVREVLMNMVKRFGLKTPVRVVFYSLKNSRGAVVSGFDCDGFKQINHPKRGSINTRSALYYGLPYSVKNAMSVAMVDALVADIKSRLEKADNLKEYQDVKKANKKPVKKASEKKIVKKDSKQVVKKDSRQMVTKDAKKGKKS
jgi:hypothetical protein